MDEELARGEAFLWREADRHGWAVLQQWGSCDGSDVARLSGGAPGSAKVTDSICFFPSEARSLAAALTAWANRVDPPKRCDFVPGEDRMFQAIDPTDVKESVEVNRTTEPPFLVTVRDGLRVAMCGLTAEKAAELAAFLERKPVGPAKPVTVYCCEHGSGTERCPKGCNAKPDACESCGRPRHTGFSCGSALDPFSVGLKISGAPVASEPDLQALKARVDALEDIDTGPAAARLAHGRIDEILKRLSEFEAWVKRVRSS